MKKLYFLLILGLLLVLCACGGELIIKGELISVYTDDDTHAALYIIRTDESETIPVTLAKDGVLFDWPEAAEEGSDGIFITAYCDRVQTPISMPDGDNIRAYPASIIMVDALRFDNAAELADGTPLSITQYRFDSRTRYSLTGGAELLIEAHPTGPENVYVGGIENFDDLSPAAQEKVRAYYENQGLLYNVTSILERAYAAYLNHNEEEPFDSFFVEQSISPTASNDHLMYFVTTVSRPISGELMYDERISAAFERNTGEYISTFELFTCPENEILPRLLDLASITDETLRSEMSAVFKPENIFFLPDNMELWFTQGTLKSEQYSYGISLPYSEELCTILDERAIPKNIN